MKKLLEIAYLRSYHFFNSKRTYIKHVVSTRWMMIWCVHTWQQVSCLHPGYAENGAGEFVCRRCGAVTHQELLDKDFVFRDE